MYYGHGGLWSILVLIADIWAIVNIFQSAASTERKVLWTVLVVLLLEACVTVNVNFPAAAAEESADRIIGKVQGAEHPRVVRDRGIDRQRILRKPEPSVGI